MRFGWRAGDRFQIETRNTHKDVDKEREQREMSIQISALWRVEDNFQSLKIVPAETSHRGFETSVQTYGLQWASTAMLSHATPFIVAPDGREVVRVVDTSAAMSALDTMLLELGADEGQRATHKEVAHGSIKETGTDLWNLMIAEWHSGQGSAVPGYVRRRFEDGPCAPGEDTVCARFKGVERRERDGTIFVRTAEILIEPDGMYPRSLDVTIEARNDATGFASTRTVSMSITKLPDAPAQDAADEERASKTQP